MTDVLIAGAGPTGLTLAIDLARRGVQCRLIDKAEAPATTSRALGVQARTLECFEHLGIADQAVAAGLPMHGIRLHSDRKIIAHIAFQNTDSKYGYVLSLPQSGTERLLTERLNAENIPIERGCELLSARDTGDRVEALVSKNGQTEPIECKYLAGCDGAHSKARQQAGIAFEGSAFPEKFLLADLSIDGYPTRDEANVYLQEGRIVAIFPMPDGHYRIVLEDPGQQDGDPTLEEIQKAIDLYGPAGVRVHDSIWTSRFHISQRQVTAYRSGRTFLLGDAAHIHSPIGGQGMNTGIQDALNLGWKLALAVEGKAAPELLDSYNAERRPVGARLLHATGAATHVALAANPLLEGIRNQVIHSLTSFNVVQHEMQRAISQIAVNYHDSPIVTQGGERLQMPATNGMRHLLLASKNSPIAQLATSDYGPYVDQQEPSPPNGKATLLRPDGYVGLKAHAADPDSLHRYFSRVLASP
jgi:2-polyprenyl-6-methoxyphenol hydroxylase-like FAD-dependent oxidoreductase